MMKKSVRAAMTLTLMVMCAFFCLNPSAADVVGRRGDTGTPTDGVVDAPNGNALQSPIGVAIVDTVSRYAVDITYPSGGLVVRFDGAVLWNTATYRYEAYPDTSPATSYALTVTNHSDKAVFAYGEAEASSAFFQVALQGVETESVRIPGVMVGADKGTEGTLSLSVGLRSTWSEIINEYAGNPEEGIRVGGLRVFIKSE